MRLTIIGTNTPGRTFCLPDGTLMDNVHVGVQRRREPTDLIPADALHPSWEIDIVDRDGTLDFRGAAVHSKPGGRFVWAPPSKTMVERHRSNRQRAVAWELGSG